MVSGAELLTRQLGSRHQSGRTVPLFRTTFRQVISFKPAATLGHRWVGAWLRKVVAACVFILAAIPALAQTTPTTDQKQGDQKQGVGSIRGTLTTTQADGGSGGLAGISVQLAAQP